MLKEDTKLLLDWYDAERRILPWREDPTPYHVWVSEIMLQQTRVEAVKDYYARFLATLPDVASLAAADEDTYLKLWEGLGYYSRVRNMHKAAVTIMEDYGGEIPSTAKELQKLSGIGEYTAAAIASIAFQEPVSSVDGNLLRVYARRNLYRENIKEPAAKKLAYDYYMERMPEERPGDYNQALMDLGATVCLPNGEPECSRCPWADLCEAHKQGVELEVPVVPAKKARRVEHRNVYRVHCGDALLLSKRPDTGLLAGLYEFPNDLLENAAGKAKKNTPEKLTKKQVADLSRKALDRFLADNDLTPVSVFPLPAAKHIFSHVEWHMTGYDIEVASFDALSSNTEPDPAGDGRALFASPLSELDRYSIPNAFDAFKF
ncbi:MAG: A/G-specific adenine glycosylase [Clostridia bacterium]|nr:A/G-specific adenine glycosylase [Clostridia bacterium]